ncbi:MAG: DNA polymerase III subunit gamma/tau [Elusimicrobiales bacterium]|nr:DNA polymerase III subunit gamma/tau [Elusimicrobiales bacterium]
MESIALKYRPKVFDDLVGQDTISKTLSNSIKSGKIYHSYLFYGPRGCGKTSTARILAKALNCHSPVKQDPCNECISCKEISAGNSIDVVEIDAASYTQVQNIRDVIIDNVNLSPSRDKYRIYILDEVHMLSNNAFNALLKTIEEPPDHAVFILATTEINKVPLTIISRCQTFRFKPIPDRIMLKRLEEICDKENIKYEGRALELIVNFSGGAMRDSLSILEKIASFSQNRITPANVSEILGYPPSEIIDNLSSALLSKNISEIHSIFNKINDEGIDPVLVLKELRNYFSRCFLAKNGLEELKNIPDLNPFIFVKLSRKINRIIEEIKYSDNLSLMAETFLYTVIDTTVDLDAIIKRIDSINSKDVNEENNFQGQLKKTFDKAEPNTRDDSFKGLWNKLLTSILKDSFPLYNVLLSSDISLDNDKIIINANNEFESSIVLKNLPLIEKNLSNNSSKKYTIEIGIKKKIKNEVLKNTDVVEKNDDLSSFKLRDLRDFDETFPEYNKIKKIFGSDIVKFTREK